MLLIYKPCKRIVNTLANAGHCFQEIYRYLSRHGPLFSGVDTALNPDVLH